MAGGGISLVGERQFQKTIRGYPESIQNKAMTPALRKAGRTIVPTLRRATPKSKNKRGKQAEKNTSGTTRKSTGLIVRKYRNGRIQFAVIGHSWPKGAAAHLVDAGTQDRSTKDGANRGRVEGSHFFETAKSQLPAAGKVFISELKSRLKTIAASKGVTRGK